MLGIDELGRTRKRHSLMDILKDLHAEDLSVEMNDRVEWREKESARLDENLLTFLGWSLINFITRTFERLSLSSLLFWERWYVLRPSSGMICQTLKPTVVYYSNSANYDRVEVLSIVSIPSFQLLVGIEPAISRWYHSEALFNRTSIFAVPCVQLDKSEWIFGTYKPNVSINLWDTTHYYHVRFLFTFAHIVMIFYKAFLINESQIIFIYKLGLLNRSL